MFERIHLQQVVQRIHEPRKFIQVILGPRQVGKTTLVNQLVKKYASESLVVSADAVGASNSLKKFNPDKVLLVGNSGFSWQDFLKMKPSELFG